MTTIAHEIKKLSSFSKLKHNVVDLLVRLARFTHGVVVHFNKVDDVGVRELAKNFYFIFYELFQTLVRLEDLDCVSFAVGIGLTDFYFAAGSAADGSSE